MKILIALSTLLFLSSCSEPNKNKIFSENIDDSSLTEQSKDLEKDEWFKLQEKWLLTEYQSYLSDRPEGKYAELVKQRTKIQKDILNQWKDLFILDTEKFKQTVVVQLYKHVDLFEHSINSELVSCVDDTCFALEQKKVDIENYKELLSNNNTPFLIKIEELFKLVGIHIPDLEVFYKVVMNEY